MNGPRRRVAYGQNFLRHPQTARALVEAADVGRGDRVYDLGAGPGAMTHALLAVGAQVVAVERDANLALRLRRRFAGQPVTVVEADLNDVPFAAPFKVVANIPFNQTAATMRRLFFAAPHPQMAQLVVQREAAEKYAGIGRLSAVSLMLKPWFEVRVVCALAADEFMPRPAVECAALQVVPRATALLGDAERAQWNAFIRYTLARSKPGARVAFRNVLSGLQWRLLARDLGIAPDAALAALTLEQWLGVYRFVRRCVPARKQERIFAAPDWPAGLAP